MRRAYRPTVKPLGGGRSTARLRRSSGLVACGARSAARRNAQTNRARSFNTADATLEMLVSRTGSDAGIGARAVEVQRASDGRRFPPWCSRCGRHTTRGGRQSSPLTAADRGRAVGGRAGKPTSARPHFLLTPLTGPPETLGSRTPKSGSPDVNRGRDARRLAGCARRLDAGGGKWLARPPEADHGERVLDRWPERFRRAPRRGAGPSHPRQAQAPRDA